MVWSISLHGYSNRAVNRSTALLNNIGFDIIYLFVNDHFFYISSNFGISISGASTDLLVVCGVASVKISAIMTYFVPLMIMFSLAYVLVIAWAFIVGPRCSDHDWLERAMIAFGQSTGVLATGILLLRVVDPDLKSKGLEDSGTTNLLNRPIIIALQALVPYFVAQSGMTPYLTGWICIGAFLLLLVIAIKFKWLHSPVKN